MGFTDRSANIRALTSARGNLNRAIEILMENPPEAGADVSPSSASPAETGGGAESDGRMEADDARASTSRTSTRDDEGEGGRENDEPKGSAEKKND